MDGTCASRNAPIAVIGFSDQPSPLEPLWPGTHRALLPLAGKSLIVYLVEQLADAGIRHVRIAGSIQQYAVRKRLRCGREWGITVRYSDLHGDELLAECLASEGRCLYLLGDHLYDADFNTLVERAMQTGLPADLGADEAGLWCIRDGRLQGHSLGVASGAPTYENALTRARDYHDVNLRAARGQLSRLNIPGAPLHRAAIADWQSTIAPDACIGRNVFIGKHCRVAGLARLESDCVLANGVVVDGGARLRNVIVLPNSYVGRHMRLCDAVLGPDRILDLHGNSWPVKNGEFLGATRDNVERLTGLPDRLWARG